MKHFTEMLLKSISNLGAAFASSLLIASVLTLGLSIQPVQAQSIENFSLEDNNSVLTIRAKLKRNDAAPAAPVNIWISAVKRDGTYFYNGNSFVRHTGGPRPAAIRGRVLSNASEVVVAKDINIAEFNGADFYVGYGRTEQELDNSNRRLTKVHQVARRMQFGRPPTQ